MKAAHGIRSPSIALLRFLRCQLDVQTTAYASPARRIASRVNTSSSRQCRHASTISAPLTRAETASARPQHRPTSHERHSPRRPTFCTSSRRASIWDRLRAGSAQPQSGRNRQDELAPLPGFLDDSAGLSGRIIKPSNELKLRCTEVDENGNVVLVNGEFRKSELIAKYSLLPRDLRKIDSSVLPHILVRPSAILINLLHLRCLIKHNRVLIFDVYGSTDSYAQSVFMYDLEGRLRQHQKPAYGGVIGAGNMAGGNLPYEFRALEAVLISVTTGLEGEFEGVRAPMVQILRELEEDIDRDKLRHLLIYSKKLSTFHQKATLVRDAIEDLLEADDDLAAMYLTEKAFGVTNEHGEIGRSEDDHEEVELLLESYHKVADEIVQVSSNLVSAIRNTEEIVRAILDANRNSLMLLELKFSIGTLGISAGMFIAALYGMNLENFIEESNYGFFGISGFSTVIAVIACMYGLRKLRKVQRVTMWGESRGSSSSTSLAPAGGYARASASASAKTSASRSARSRPWWRPSSWLFGRGSKDSQVGGRGSWNDEDVPQPPPTPTVPPAASVGLGASLRGGLEETVAGIRQADRVRVSKDHHKHGKVLPPAVVRR